MVDVNLGCIARLLSWTLKKEQKKIFVCSCRSYVVQ